MISFISIFLGFLFSESEAAILLHTRDAVVWHPEQTITGELSGFTAEKVVVHHDQLSFAVHVTNEQEFTFRVTLRDRENKIWVEVPDNPAMVSDTLHYRLGYQPTPIVKPVATVIHNKAVLHATLMENPYKVPLKYEWMPDAGNPARCQILHNEDSIVRVEIPLTQGIYHFNLLVVAGRDSTWFQTFVRRDAQGIHAFEIDTDYPLWMDTAVIYQITPYAFVRNGTFADITAKLHEIKSLGINTLLFQPVFPTFFGEQGYDVTDYLAVNPALGTEKQLQHLIATAKALNMKVLFDVVLNHTSLHHPYAKDRIQYGMQSHYYDYYQHEKDGKPYSSFYNQDAHGFINYFWEHLVNLNYQNEEVQRWMLEVCKYWVREFDIDGYRFDAIWGVNARMPSFAERLRTELKSIKPEVLLLAEDKGSVAEVFALGFDAAYDWTSDTTWISQWPWEYKYEERKSHTLFHFPRVAERGEMLRQALFHNGGNAHRKLRYIENNDLPRFILEHGLTHTKMAAALLFSLPGIPMVYNGQEIGSRGHPYSTEAIFRRHSTIRSLDEKGLFAYYQKLISMHKKYPALSDTAMQALSVSPEGAMVAFHRWKAEEHFIIVVNLDEEEAKATIDLREIFTQKAISENFQLKDVLADTVFVPKRNASQVKINMKGYSVRWLLLQESGI